MRARSNTKPLVSALLRMAPRFSVRQLTLTKISETRWKLGRGPPASLKKTPKCDGAHIPAALCLRRCSRRNENRRGLIMWQLYATFRLGDFESTEVDLTPAIGIGLILAVLGLVIRTGL
jgi:hypothetical protein